MWETEQDVALSLGLNRETPVSSRYVYLCVDEAHSCCVPSHICSGPSVPQERTERLRCHHLVRVPRAGSAKKPKDTVLHFQPRLLGGRVTVLVPERRTGLGTTPRPQSLPSRCEKRGSWLASVLALGVHGDLAAHGLPTLCCPCLARRVGDPGPVCLLTSPPSTWADTNAHCLG